MVLEVVKIIATVVTATFASGGVVMYWLKKHDRVNELEKKFDRFAEGMKLGLENDVVIFKALREGHINGESEEQEKKLREYFFNCSMRGLEKKGGANE